MLFLQAFPYLGLCRLSFPNGYLLCHSHAICFETKTKTKNWLDNKKECWRLVSYNIHMSNVLKNPVNFIMTKVERKWHKERGLPRSLSLIYLKWKNITCLRDRRENVEWRCSGWRCWPPSGWRPGAWGLGCRPRTGGALTTTTAMLLNAKVCGGNSLSSRRLSRPGLHRLLNGTAIAPAS